MLAEKPCRILTDVNYTYSVSVFLIRKSRGTLLACLAVCPVMHLQDCHLLPRRTLQYSHERELPKLLLVKALCESNARMTDHHLLAFWLLCAMLAPQRICVSLGDGDQYPQAVTCEHPISACGHIMALCSVCTPRASSQGSSAIAGLAPCCCAGADLPQPVGCLGAILQRDHTVARDLDCCICSIEKVLLQFIKLHSQRVVFCWSAQELHQTVRYVSDTEQKKSIPDISPRVPAFRDLLLFCFVFISLKRCSKYYFKIKYGHLGFVT